MSKFKFTIFSLLLFAFSTTAALAAERDFRPLQNHLRISPQSVQMLSSASYSNAARLVQPKIDLSASRFAIGTNTVGSLAVITNNGTLELQSNSIQVSSPPTKGSLDAGLNYTSQAGQDDSYIVTGMTVDGKSTVEITVFVSPSTQTYSIAYVGATQNYQFSPTVEVTDIAGYIKGSLTANGGSWKFPTVNIGTNVKILGEGLSESQGIFVFQGDISTEAKMDAILFGLMQFEPLFHWHTAFWIPDNSTMGGGNVVFGNQPTNHASFVSWGRWREILVGAVVGAAVGFAVGGPAGAIAGGVIGGAGAWGVDRVVDPNDEEFNYVYAGCVGVVGGIGGGYLGPAIVGGGGGGASGGGGAGTNHWINSNMPKAIRALEEIKRRTPN